MVFAYFDFMYRHGWLSPEGHIRDYIVATAPGWIALLSVVGFIWLTRVKP